MFYILSCESLSKIFYETYWKCYEIIESKSQTEQKKFVQDKGN